MEYASPSSNCSTATVRSRCSIEISLDIPSVVAKLLCRYDICGTLKSVPIGNSSMLLPPARQGSSTLSGLH
eukprot:scaffold8529_cov137-Cylindrotheca_fusiformis.AAC.2